MATYQGGQKQADAFTLAEINRNKALVLQAYRDAQKEITKELAYWWTYLEGISPKDGGYYNAMIQYNRLENMQKAIAEIYTVESLSAGNITKESSKMAISNRFYREQYIQQWFGGVAGYDMAFSFINPAVIEAGVFGTQKVWENIKKTAREKIENSYGSLSIYAPKAGSLTQLLIDNRTQELAAIRKKITQGLLLGKPYSQVAADVAKIIGKEIPGDGRVKLSGAKSSAVTIVRTEGNRVLNAGAYAYDRYATEVYDLPMKRQLLSTIDLRTRQQSGEMDGQQVEVDEPFHYPNGATSLYPGNTGYPEYDTNDRETVISIIDGIAPEGRRRLNPVTGQSEVFSFTSFEDWRKVNNLKWSKSGKLVQSK